MVKVPISNIANLDNPPSAVATLNANFKKLQEAFDLVLFRNGLSPNQMLSLLDMNSHRVINLPKPVDYTDAARHGDIQIYVDQAEDFAKDSEASAERSEIAADKSESLRDETQVLHDDFFESYLGTFPSHPGTDYKGDPIKDGGFYYNSTTSSFWVYVHRLIISDGKRVVSNGSVVYTKDWQQLPKTTLSSLTDVDWASVSHGDVLRYDVYRNMWVGSSYTADQIEFDKTGTIYNSSDVQGALEEISTRTSLGQFELVFFAQGAITENEEMMRMVTSRPFSIRVGSPSRAAARQGPNLTTTFTLLKGLDVVGSIVFAPGSLTGTVTTYGDVSFNEGDILVLRAPSSSETALRDFSLTLSVWRN